MTLVCIDYIVAVAKIPPKDESDFASMIAGVKRLNDDRINVYQQRPAKTVVAQTKPALAERDFANLSFEQQTQTLDSFFDHGIQRKLQRRIRQGQLPVDDSLDLHGCTQKMAFSELSQFFEQSISHGHKMVIIIHGKGQRSQNTAVLKPLALHWLSQQNSVLAWCPAQPKDGGHGASYVYLR